MPAFYRVHLPTMTFDETPLPDYLRGYGREELADLSWIPPEYDNGYTIGYAWWMGAGFSENLAPYERYGEVPELTIDPENKFIKVVYPRVPWTAEEIAADQAAKYDGTSHTVISLAEDYMNEVARGFGFYGPCPMMSAISFSDSTLPEVAARAQVLKTWRDGAYAAALSARDAAVTSGLVPGAAALNAVLPAAPALPEDQTETPPAPPVDEPEETAP